MRRLILAAVFATACTTPVWAHDAGDKTKRDMMTDPDFHTLTFSPGEKGNLERNSILTTSAIHPDGKTTTITVESSYTLVYQKDGDAYTVTRPKVESKVLSFQSPEAAAGSPQAHGIAGMANLLNDIPDLSYTANGDLKPVRVNDLPAIQVRLTAAMRDIFSKADAPPATLASVDQMASSIIRQFTPETAAPGLLEGDILMALPHNIGLVLHKPLTTASQVTAPIGGAILAATESMELTAWDTAANTAHMTYDLVPAQASLKDFMDHGMPIFLKQMGAPDAAIADFQKKSATLGADAFIQASTHCDFDVAIDTGLVTKGICTKTDTFKIGNQTSGRTETYEFSENRKN